MTKRQFIFNGVAMAFIMSFIISAGLTVWNVGTANFMKAWPTAWFRAYVIAQPCVFIVPRIIRWMIKTFKI